MPVTSQWLVFNRVMLHRLAGVVTLDDASITDRLARVYLEMGTPPVHSIVDRRQATQMPYHVKALRDTLHGLKHPHNGWFIVVSDPEPLVDFIGYAVMRFNGVEFHRVNTLNDAIAFLWAQDSTLPHPAPRLDE